MAAKRGEIQYIDLDDVELEFSGAQAWTAGTPQPEEGPFKCQLKERDGRVVRVWRGTKGEIRCAVNLKFPNEYTRSYYINLPVPGAEKRESYEGALKQFLIAAHYDKEWVAGLGLDDDGKKEELRVPLSEILGELKGTEDDVPDEVCVYFWPSPEGVANAEPAIKALSPEEYDDVVATGRAPAKPSMRTNAGTEGTRGGTRPPANRGRKAPVQTTTVPRRGAAVAEEEPEEEEQVEEEEADDVAGRRSAVRALRRKR